MELVGSRRGRFSQTQTVPTFAAAGVVNAANYKAGPVVPGEIVDIFGDGLGPATLAPLQLTASGLISNSLAGTQVLFDGTPAPLLFVQQKQIAAVVPYATAGKSTTQVKVITTAGSSVPVALQIGSTSPGLFTYDASGKGLAAALNQDGVTVNSAQNPAVAGTIVALFGTGEGATIPKGVDGQIIGSLPLPFPGFPVGVTIGGLPTNVVYAGSAPGLVAGVFQIDVQIPYGVTPGNAVPLVVSIGSHDTGTAVNLAVSAPTTETTSQLGMKFEPNLSDSLIAELTDSLGPALNIFGNRGADGTPVNLTSLDVYDSQKQKTTFQLDSQGRPSVVQAGNGTVLLFNWTNATHAVVTATSPDGAVSANTQIDLSGTSNSAREQARHIVRSGGKPEAIFPPNTTPVQVNVTRCGKPTDDALVSIKVIPTGPFSPQPLFGPDVMIGQTAEQACQCNLATPTPGVYYVPIPVPDPDAGNKALQRCNTFLNAADQGRQVICSSSLNWRVLCSSLAGSLLPTPLFEAAPGVLAGCAEIGVSTKLACSLYNASTVAFPGYAQAVGAAFCQDVKYFVDRSAAADAQETLLLVPHAVYGDHVGEC